MPRTLAGRRPPIGLSGCRRYTNSRAAYRTSEGARAYITKKHHVIHSLNQSRYFLPLTAAFSFVVRKKAGEN
jgi:hypothetical protein